MKRTDHSSKWQQLIGKLRARHSEPQNLIRYFTVGDERVAAVTQLRPGGTQAGVEYSRDDRLSA